MPLSEDEQRRLDEIERALRADDPKFAAGHSIERVWRRRMVVAGAVVLVGVMLLVVGLVTTQASLAAGLIISIVGFLAMVGGAAMFIRRPRG
jgi:hypothetical protein